MFELECALAFLWFVKKNCDLVLLEAGMGGRDDATNIVRNKICKSENQEKGIRSTKDVNNSGRQILEICMEDPLSKEGRRALEELA